MLAESESSRFSVTTRTTTTTKTTTTSNTCLHSVMNARPNHGSVKPCQSRSRSRSTSIAGTAWPSQPYSASLSSLPTRFLITCLLLSCSPFSLWPTSSTSFVQSVVQANSIVNVQHSHFVHDPIDHQHLLHRKQPSNAQRSSERTSNELELDDPSQPKQHHHLHSANEIHGTPVAPVSIKPDLYGLISDVNVECNSNDIRIQLLAPHLFNGMIYPKGLSKNSSCMAEYSEANNFTYLLPLRACNTMSTEVTDGVEYFNTVIVQPHRRLVTNQGRGYHIRCRYQTREKRITNGFNVSMSTGEDRENGVDNGPGTTPLFGTAPMPTCSMKIFVADTQNEIVAENVKIGDRLSLIITIDQQDIYGMKITNCLVRDGLNWGEQPLINDEGCPVDSEIMGQFDYTQNITRASVSFHAHKFPYTASVYYQCNVRLCLKEGDGCDDVPPSCDRNGRNYRHRARRDTYDAVVIPAGRAGAPVPRDQYYLTQKQQQRHSASALTSRVANQMGDKDLSMEVHSGLYVDENEETKDIDDQGLDDDDEDGDGVYRSGKHRNSAGSSEEFCISMRKFAIGVAIASLLLMFAVILLVICILQRRRRRSQHRRLFSSGSTVGSSSIYSGPYTNRAYSRD